ncbi:MAG TPA: patatin-like phospholipase family protein [Chitinophagaceae bacterium]|nr:patatin-like phospholipase family protein [Chitinophagaceae bacterium]
MKSNRFSRVISSMIAFWRISYPILYSIAMLFIAWYAFRQNDQGRDFFVGVIGKNISLTYIAKSLTMLVLWCLLLWYSTRIVLQVKRLEVPNNNFTGFVIKWFPRLIGIFPFFIVINAQFHAASIITTENKQTLWYNSLQLIIAALAMMSFFIFRKKIAGMMKIDFQADEERFTTGKTSLKELLAARATRIALALIVLTISIMTLLFFTPASWGFARALQPATVVLSGLIFFTFIISLVILFINIRRSPVFLLIGAYIVLLSTCNNNNSIRTIETAGSIERMPVSQNFQAWIQAKLNKHKLRDSLNKTYPVFIIAAEGGGIRASTWTALVLKKLQQLRPDFMDHVYAISGVSGGGVGAAFYTAYLHDQLTGKLDQFPSAPSSFEQTVSDDFLSDLTAGFIYHDNLQRILPWPIESLSRNRKLENSWGLAWKARMFSATMDSSFLNIWKNDSSFSIPNVLINGLLAETGQKAITSNLELNTSSFRDDIDVIGKLGSDIPLKTAASLGARFPVITSGALLKEEGKIPLGHILDGGYKENSGIETAWQLSLALDTLLTAAEINSGYHLPLHILFIQNSTNGKTFDENYKGAAKILPDISTIIPGFMNAWERRTTTHKNITRELFENNALKNRFRYFELRLVNKDRSLPLGWYLSDAARNNIIHQVDTITKDNPVLQY